MSEDPCFGADPTYSKQTGCPNTAQWLRAGPQASSCSTEHFSCREVVDHEKISPGKRRSFILTPPAVGLAVPNSSAHCRLLKVVTIKSFPTAFGRGSNNQLWWPYKCHLSK